MAVNLVEAFVFVAEEAPTAQLTVKIFVENSAICGRIKFKGALDGHAARGVNFCVAVRKRAIVVVGAVAEVAPKPAKARF